MPAPANTNDLKTQFDLSGGLAVQTYNASATYQVGDVIRDGNSWWMCVKPNTSGEQPGMIAQYNWIVGAGSAPAWVFINHSWPNFAGGIYNISQSIANNTDTVIQLSNEVTSAAMNEEGSYRIAIPITGDYLVSVQVHFEDGAMANGVGDLTIAVYRGSAGSPYPAFFERRKITGTGMHVVLTSPVYLNSGEYLTLRLFHTNGQACSLSSTNQTRLLAAGIRTFNA